MASLEKESKRRKNMYVKGTSTATIELVLEFEFRRHARTKVLSAAAQVARRTCWANQVA
jgi:hypothetical protein